MLAFETEDVLQAWALPMENIIGVGGFVLALAADPLTSGLGREGLLECRTSSVAPERLRLEDYYCHNHAHFRRPRIFKISAFRSLETRVNSENHDPAMQCRLTLTARRG